MPGYSITSANSVFLISVPLLSIVNHELQRYGADEAFSSENVEVTENKIGVDGYKSAGYTPQLAVQNITLQADSDSLTVFELIYERMRLSQEILYITGVISLPALKKFYALGQGTLLTYKPILDAQRVMQQAQYSINWGEWIVTPTGA